MAQTRRMRMQNGRAQLAKAPRFSLPPYARTPTRAGCPLRRIIWIGLFGRFKLRPPKVQAFLYPALKADIGWLIVAPALGQIRLWYVAAFEDVCVHIPFSFSQQLAPSTTQVFRHAQNTPFLISSIAC